MLRVIPHLLTQQNEYFQVDNCTFGMESYKVGSGRQIMFNEFKILNSFTLENSFFVRFTADEMEALKEQQMAQNL